LAEDVVIFGYLSFVPPVIVWSLTRAHDL